MIFSKGEAEITMLANYNTANSSPYTILSKLYTSSGNSHKSFSFNPVATASCVLSTIIIASTEIIFVGCGDALNG